MSTTYSDLLYTNYPDACDSYEYMQDLSSDLIDLVSQYESLINTKKFSEANKLLTDNPTLNKIYFNAEKYNKIIDSVKAIQRLYFSDIQKYIEQLITFRGTYSSTISYKKYDVVEYNGSAYLCVSDSDIGILPTSDKWIQITLKGDQGVPGLGLNFSGIWSATITYPKDSCVTYNNVLYASSIDDNLAKTPSSNSDVWNVVFDISQIVSYDNSSSGLSSTNLQNAIDELLTKIITNESNINTNANNISTNTNNISTINNSISDINSRISNVDNTHDSEKSVNYSTSSGTANYANSAGSASSATNANYATSAGNSDTVDGFHFTVSTTDLTPGSSSLAANTFYFVYE